MLEIGEFIALDKISTIFNKKLYISIVLINFAKLK